jgi:XTP/dITP diphosphohydrolase
LTQPLLIATRSEGKLRELLPLLASHGLQAESLGDAGIEETPDEADLECFDTFEANALAKARWFSRLAPGRIVLADDSGLAVDALDGRPGVASKRWSNRPDLAGSALDEENNRLLLAALDQAAARGDGRRSAAYICAAACCGDGLEMVAQGETRGTIVHEPQGRGGFGYDPFFLSDDLGRTFAEVSREEKAAVSHRGRAFRALLDGLIARGLPRIQ